MKVLWLVVCLLVVGWLGACRSNAGAPFEAADSLQVVFHPPGNRGNITKTVGTGNRQVIQNLSRFIGSKEADSTCGFTGELVFFQAGRAFQQMSFHHSNEGCAVFSWQANGTRHTRRMSREGALFFQAMEKGQASY